MAEPFTAEQIRHAALDLAVALHRDRIRFKVSDEDRDLKVESASDEVMTDARRFARWIAMGDEPGAGEAHSTSGT